MCVIRAYSLPPVIRHRAVDLLRRQNENGAVPEIVRPDRVGPNRVNREKIEQDHGRDPHEVDRTVATHVRNVIRKILQNKNQNFLEKNHFRKLGKKYFRKPNP